MRTLPQRSIGDLYRHYALSLEIGMVSRTPCMPILGARKELGNG